MVLKNDSYHFLLWLLSKNSLAFGDFVLFFWWLICQLKTPCPPPIRDWLVCVLFSGDRDNNEELFCPVEHQNCLEDGLLNKGRSIISGKATKESDCNPVIHLSPVVLRGILNDDHHVLFQSLQGLANTLSIPWAHLKPFVVLIHKNS